MESGSSSGMGEKVDRRKGQRKPPGSTSGAGAPKIEPFVPRQGYDPRELKSWAKRTGFVSTFSGETETASLSGGDFSGRNLNVANGNSNSNVGFDLERGFDKTEAPNGETKDALNGIASHNSNAGVNGNEHLVQPATSAIDPKKEDGNVDYEMEIPDGEDPSSGGWLQSPRIKCGLRENPGYVALIYYGLQHFLSLVGSIIFIPLITVPAMGGTDKDTATVISTMLLVTGLTTVLHSYFGTRLPLVQGSSFVFLAPALVIINSEEYRNLAENKFRHIMRELQGAIIVGSIFQSIFGFSGLMSLFLRLINPVVVAPTIAAVGLSFFSYGFPQAGSCVEISLPQIILALAFTLVPLSVVMTWAYAFFLTAGGAYNYKGCSSDIPSSNILIDACRKHAYTMQHCRTDVSNAMRTAAWVRIPYPLQWGMPIFRLRTSVIMIVVSLVASVDSVGTYHSASMRMNLKPPTPGIVSRGIGLEGFCSILAGLWGTGTASTTLTENVHTIDVTKVASRRALQLGSVFLILFSFVGKVGAILASIPLALAAAVLCFIWALIVALGLSTLQYTQTSSFRNIMIVGVSLFLGFSIPAYFQQYQPESSLILPGYLIPYAAASNGPVHSGNTQFNFALNALMSLNMVVTLLVAFILDNTVPGTRQERGVYIWSNTEDIAADPSSFSDYSLPSKLDIFLLYFQAPLLNPKAILQPPDPAPQRGQPRHSLLPLQPAPPSSSRTQSYVATHLFAFSVSRFPESSEFLFSPPSPAGSQHVIFPERTTEPCLRALVAVPESSSA
nr:nucleobase-ascorbate transporter 11 [Ipomoea batatas]